METRVYLIVAIVAIALMGFGYYSITIGGTLNIIIGFFFFIVGLLLGLVFFGDKWNLF
jgi:hypothetical protein